MRGNQLSPASVAGSERARREIVERISARNAEEIDVSGAPRPRLS